MSNIDNTSNISNIPKGDINRLKVVLVEQKKTAKWLAEKVGRDPATVSKCRRNIVVCFAFLEFETGLFQRNCTVQYNF